MRLCKGLLDIPETIGSAATHTERSGAHATQVGGVSGVRVQEGARTPRDPCKWEMGSTALSSPLPD